MYATKRKLHNLLQAATGSGASGGSSTGGAGAGDGHGNRTHKRTESTDSTKGMSKFSTVFRSKSTANIAAKAAASKGSGTGSASGSIGGAGGGKDKRPTTAGAVVEGVGVGVGVPGSLDTDMDGAGPGGNAETTLVPSDPTTPTALTTTPDPKKRRTIAMLPSESDITHTHESWSIRTTNPTATQSTAFSLSEKPTPAYAPWDRPQFLSRLKTFRFVDKWSAKPPPVNEVVWAKRGWVCVDKNRVRCTVCSRDVVVKIDADDEALEEEEEQEREDGGDVKMTMVDMEGQRIRREERRRLQRELVNRYRGMVVTEHEDYCLWRRRGCDDTIYHLPLANPSHSIPSLRSRYASLMAIEKDLPSAIDYPTSVVDFNRIKHVVQLVQEPHVTSPSSSTNAATPTSISTDPPEIIQSAFILALFGWANEEPSIPTLLTCSACFRRLGLWLFKQHAPSVSGDGEEDAMVCRLDVVGEHRDYCPWVNKESQGREPGWKTLWKMVGLQVGALGGERRVDFGYTTSHTHSSSISVIPSASATSSGENGGDRSSGGELATANVNAAAAAARARALSTPVPSGSAAEVEHVPTAAEREEHTSKMESRLKRLKTVYFGAGKKRKEERDGRARASSLVVGLGRKEGS